MNTGKNVLLLGEFLASANGTGADMQFQLGPDTTTTIQSQITAAGGVTIEGRLSPDAPWTLIPTTPAVISASGFATCRSMTWLRVVVAGNTGTVRVWAMS